MINKRKPDFYPQIFFWVMAIRPLFRVGLILYLIHISVFSESKPLDYSLLPQLSNVTWGKGAHIGISKHTLTQSKETLLVQPFPVENHAWPGKTFLLFEPDRTIEELYPTGKYLDPCKASECKVTLFNLLPSTVNGLPKFQEIKHHSWC